MKSVLRMVACRAACSPARRGSAAAADVPLDGTPAASFGPGNLDVIVGGVGLETQPGTFSVTCRPMRPSSPPISTSTAAASATRT